MLGDSLCALNPAYQQGMTLAAVAGEILGTVLARATSAQEVAPRTYRLLAPLLRDAWLVATHEHGAPAGEHPLRRLQQSHLRRVARASAISPAVRRAHIEVLHMTARPRRLMRPSALASIARASIDVRGATVSNAAGELRPSPVRI